MNIERNVNLEQNLNVGGTIATASLKIGDWYIEVTGGGQLYIHQ
jgi:hypothetical protein